MIDLIITACLMAGSLPACEDIKFRTDARTREQCEMMGQPMLAQIMAAYPKRHVVRYACKEVRTGRDA